MHQLSAALYELRHETSSGDIWKSLLTLLLLLGISVLATQNMFFNSYDDIASASFILTMALFWVGIFNSITIICRIRARIKLQVVQGMDITQYVGAHIIYQFYQSLIQAAIVTIFFQIACSLDILKKCPTDGIILPYIFEFFIYAFLVIFSADMLGLAISSACKSEVSAMMVMPIVLIVELVMANAILQLPTISDFNVGWLSMLMISRWGTVMLGSISNIESFKPSMEEIIKLQKFDPQKADQLLNPKEPQLVFSYNVSTLIACLVVMAAFSIVCIFASWYLISRVRKERLL